MAFLVTALVGAVSQLVPERYAGTAIGFCFLIATYVLVLKSDTPGIEKHYGLSLGGLLEPEPIALGRLFKATLWALCWAVGFSLLLFPPFWFGYVQWYGVQSRSGTFVPSVDGLTLLDQVFAQLTVIALPEEAFYRGYLQTALDRIWRPRFKVLGARVGLGLVVASAVFALGHLLTEPFLGRLAVFFPSLVFGWLRARTGGIGAAVAFHAACNLFTWYLGRGYGLFDDP